MAALQAPAAPRACIDTERLRLDHPIAELVTRYGVQLRRSDSALFLTALLLRRLLHSLKLVIPNKTRKDGEVRPTAILVESALAKRGALRNSLFVNNVGNGGRCGKLALAARSPAIGSCSDALAWLEIQV
jgi:hypothetical protein